MFPIFFNHEYHYTVRGLMSSAPMYHDSLFALDGQDLFDTRKDFALPLVQKILLKKIDPFLKNISVDPAKHSYRLLPLMSKTSSQATKGWVIFVEGAYRHFDHIDDDGHQSSFLELAKSCPVRIYSTKPKDYPDLKTELEYLINGVDKLRRFPHGEEVSISLDFHRHLEKLAQIFQRSELDVSTSKVQKISSLNRI